MQETLEGISRIVCGALDTRKRTRLRHYRVILSCAHYAKYTPDFVYRFDLPPPHLLNIIFCPV